jgi:hypothetical protein
MTDAHTQPRDEATGQFTPSTEQLFGREYDNAQAGFTTKKDEPAGDDRTYSDTLEGVQEAGRDLALKRASAPATVEVSVDAVREHWGAKPDIKEVATPEQAARELSALRGAVATYTEGTNLNNLADQVDKARAEALKNNPKAAEELGLSQADVEAAKADGESKEADKSMKASPDPAPSDGAVEGLDPVVAKALEHPQVRAAIAEELGKAETAQRSYANAVNYANQLAQATLVDAIPELAQIPIESWEAALSLLYQNGDGRVARAMGIIERVSQLSTAQAQWSQHQAQHQTRIAQQQFVSSTEAEDARLIEALGEEVAAEANQATVSFLADHGISRHEAFDFISKHPVLATAQARTVIYKAAQWDAAQKASKTVRAKPLPPVQRPGVSTGRTAAGDNSAKIAALQQQLAGAKGQAAVRIAGQIRNLSRRS